MEGKLIQSHGKWKDPTGRAEVLPHSSYKVVLALWLCPSNNKLFWRRLPGWVPLDVHDGWETVLVRLAVRSQTSHGIQASLLSLLLN